MIDSGIVERYGVLIEARESVDGIESRFLIAGNQISDRTSWLPEPALTVDASASSGVPSIELGMTFAMVNIEDFHFVLYGSMDDRRAFAKKLAAAFEAISK